MPGPQEGERCPEEQQLGGICVLFGRRSKGTYGAAGLVPESCMRTVALPQDLPGSPGSVGRGGECRRKWKLPSLTSLLLDHLLH